MIKNLTQRSVSAGLGWGLVAGLLLAWSAPYARADQVIADDLIVNGRVCVGVCQNDEVFGMEWTRIRSYFDDQPILRAEDEDDGTTSFSFHDWEIWANSKYENRFQVTDTTAGTNPFVIQGGAPTNSFYIDPYGNVGLGTNIPVFDLHIVTGDTPSIRLEQDASYWPPYIWDIGGNENGFWIYDATTSTYPLLIRPNGNVGVGTLAPSAKLHAYENTNANTFILAENAGTGLSSAGVLRAKSNAATVNFQAHGNGRTISRFGQTLASWAEFLQVDGNGLIIGTNGAKPLILGTAATNRLTIASNGNIGLGGVASPTQPLQHANGAYLSAGGQWINASSRELKEKIQALTAPEARDVLGGLTPVRYQYKAEAGQAHLGFIAEDVPEAVATADRKGLSPMEIVAVLTKVSQEQQARLDAQQAEIAAYRTELAAFKAQQAEFKTLQVRLAEIESQLFERRVPVVLTQR